MLRRTLYLPRRLLGDWRFLLALLLLFLFLLWEITDVMHTLGYSRFLSHYDRLDPAAVAVSYALEGEFDSLEEVWAAWLAQPEAAEYYFLSACCNTSLGSFLGILVLSLWVAGRGVRERSASALRMAGCGRLGVFLRLWIPAHACILLVLWGVFALCLRTFPIRWELLAADYVRRAVRLWLLFTASEAAVYVFLAVALGPFAATGAGLGVFLFPFLLPSALRRYFPGWAMADKKLWRPGGLTQLRPPAVVAAVVLVLALLGAWLVFRKKELH